MRLLRYLKNKHFNKLDPDGTNILLALKGTIAGGLAVLLMRFFHLPQGFWLALTSVLIVLISKNRQKKYVLIATIITGALGATVIFVSTLAGNNSFYLIPWLFTVALITGYTSRYSSNVSFCALLVLVFALFAAGMPGEITMAVQRALNAFAGLGLALSLTFILFPSNHRRKLRKELARTLREIGEYFFRTTADSLRGNHQHLNHYSYKMHLLAKLDNNRHLLRTITRKNERYVALIAQEERLLETILALTYCLTNPNRQTAFANILSHVHRLSHTIKSLMEQAYLCLRYKKPAPTTQEFLKEIDSMIDRIKSILTTRLQTSTVYVWPIDLANLLVTLQALKDEVVNTTQLLQSDQNGN